MQLTIQTFNRSLLLLCILPLLLFNFSSQAYSGEINQTPMEVLKKFKRDIYVTAERTGGSDEEWNLLEEQAKKALITALEMTEDGSIVADDNGQTALHLAVRNGYFSLAEVILRNDRSKKWLNLTDKDGLTAYEVAVLAIPETLMACHPMVKNPFVVVPFAVQLPYYASRKPFQKIADLLVEMGADQSVENAREWWLTNCSNQDPTSRSEVKMSKDLYQSLSQISLTVATKKKRQEIEKKIKFLIELAKLMPAKTRPTPEELQEKIDKMYYDEGLSPPNKH